MASWQVYHLWMVFPLKALSVGGFSATFDYHGGRHLGKDSQRGCARTLGLSQPFFPAGCLMKRKVNPHWRTNGYMVDHYLLINGMPNLSLLPKRTLILGNLMVLTTQFKGCTLEVNATQHKHGWPVFAYLQC